MAQALPEVRIAQPTEADAVMAMCRRLHAENGLFSLNEEKVLKVIERCFKRELVIVGVVGEPGKLEGSICLMLSDYYYTDDWHVAELWNYVQPEYRRSRNAEALIRYGMDVAKRMHLPLVTGIVTNQSMAGKVRLYRRMLGTPAGAFFVYNSQWQAQPLEDYSELCHRLKDFANKCTATPRSITFTVAQKQVAPLLREAAIALGREDNLFGSAGKSNGAAAGAG